jgi:simple sugar transport system ATP-binding protein
LSLEGIFKAYGHVEALRGASFDVLAGEVHALLGDNGAGKSTLLKIATGAVKPDAGVISFQGREVHFASPLDARRIGVETVYQDLALSEDRSCVANIFAGRERMRGGLLGHMGVLDRRSMRAATRQAFDELSITVEDPDQIVRQLSGGQKQGVAIARAAMWANKVVLMDEPTAALGVRQRAEVEGLIDRLRSRGFAVVLISHDVLEVLKIADRVTVLRQGKHVATRPAIDVDLEWVVRAMVGGMETA